MKTKFLIIPLFLFSLLTTANDKFEKGVEAFKQGDYDAAYAAWSGIPGESAALHYNIGNYWFLKGELGKSILHYEKALQIDPKDDEILHNLEIANNQRIDEFETIPPTIATRFLYGFLGLISSNTWLSFGVIAFALSILFWVLFLKTDLAKRKFFFAFFTAGLVGVLFTTFSYARYKVLDSKQQAIITSPNVYVKNGPAEKENDAFILHEGTKVEIKSKENNWVKIKLPDGKIGWVVTGDLSMI